MEAYRSEISNRCCTSSYKRLVVFGFTYSFVFSFWSACRVTPSQCMLVWFAEYFTDRWCFYVTRLIAVMCLLPDVRWLSVRRYDYVKFKSTGNDVMEWRHGPSQSLPARVLVSYRLRHRHISSDDHLFVVHGSRHCRQLSVWMPVSFHFRLRFVVCTSIFVLDL